MRKDVAKDILQLMLEFGGRLDQTVEQVQRTCTEEEFKWCRKAVGRLMGVMLVDVINPIVAEHPDLRPKELKDVYGGNSVQKGSERT